MLSVLAVDDDILLAFNSSQVPPLLPNTKQNIYVPSKGQHGRSAKAAGAAAGASAEASALLKSEPKGEGGSVVKEEPGQAGTGPPSVKLERQDAGPTGSAAASGDVVMTDAAAEAAAGRAAPAPMDVDSAGAAASNAPAPFVPTVPRDVVPREVVGMVEEHIEFLHAAGQLRVRDLMHALQEYFHADAHVAYHLWVLIFPIVWTTLDKNQQVALAKPIIALMSKEYHLKQAQARPNVIQVRVHWRS